MDGQQGPITQGEVPFEDRVVPRAEIDWERSAWWWYPLTQAVLPALKLTSLLLGIAAISLIHLGLWVGDALFQPTWDGIDSLAPAENTLFGSLPQAWLTGQTLTLDWRGLAFASFVALWVTATCSALGGLLARRSLVQLGEKTVAPWGETLKIVFGRASSLAWLAGMHLVALAVILVPIWLLGWIASFGSVGANIAGVLLVLLFLPAVFATGRLCFSLIISFPLGVCAIAAEKKADAFEGFSRSNAYAFQRPVLAVLCAGVLFGVGWIGLNILYWLLEIGWNLVRSTYFLGGGSVQEASNRYILIGNAYQEYFLNGFQFSFFWAASAALYLILRKSVDGTELHELDSIQNTVEKQAPQIPATPPDAPPKPEDSDPKSTDTPAEADAPSSTAATEESTPEGEDDN